MERPLMLDLFSGTGSASAPFVCHGWEAIRVEQDSRFDAEHSVDVRGWSWTGRAPSLLWASPPCTEFARESMPWCRTGRVPSLELVRAVLRIVCECDPLFWVLENVRGSIRWLAPVLGRPLILGPVCLYGRFPPFGARVPGWKEGLSSARRTERGMIPVAVADGLRRSIQGSFSFWERFPEGFGPQG